MNSSSLPLLLATVLMVTGCQTTFTQFRVTSPRDEVIAEWISRGYVAPLDRGYGITAVERVSGPPYRTVTRYPDGLKTTVVGPHIHHWRCPEPQWLAAYERNRAAFAPPSSDK